MLTKPTPANDKTQPAERNIQLYMTYRGTPYQRDINPELAEFIHAMCSELGVSPDEFVISCVEHVQNSQ